MLNYFLFFLRNHTITMQMFLEQTAHRKRRKSTFKFTEFEEFENNEALGQGRGTEKNVK